MIGLPPNKEKSKGIGLSHGPPLWQYRLKGPSTYSKFLSSFKKPNTLQSSDRIRVMFSLKGEI